MGQIDLNSYKNLYLQTAGEYVDKISVSLDVLGKDIPDKNSINNLHISSHSLKSQSQVMGYVNIASICLNIENISDAALKGEKQLNIQVISDMRKSVEEIRNILKQI